MTDMNAVEILLVEDNPNNAELTIRSLKKQNLVNNLYTAKDGAEALDFLFCRGPYSERATNDALRVVLLDLKLPKVNGLEVLKQIKDEKTLRSIPVVIVTSSCEDPDVKAAYELGANSYVVKPVGFEAFAEEMSKIGLYWLLVNQPSK